MPSGKFVSNRENPTLFVASRLRIIKPAASGLTIPFSMPCFSRNFFPRSLRPALYSCHMLKLFALECRATLRQRHGKWRECRGRVHPRPDASCTIIKLKFKNIERYYLSGLRAAARARPYIVPYPGNPDNSKRSLFSKKNSFISHWQSNR